MLVLGPNDHKLSSDKSDMVDCRYGGKREIVAHSVYANSADYTSKAGSNGGEIVNNIEDVKKDIDDLVDLSSGKDLYTRQNELNNRDTTENPTVIDLSVDEVLTFCEDTKAFIPEAGDITAYYGSKLGYYYGNVSTYKNIVNIVNINTTPDNVSFTAVIDDIAQNSFSFGMGVKSESIISVDWGDNSVSTHGAEPTEMVTHEYTSVGRYVVKLSGDLSNIGMFGFMYESKLEFDWNLAAMVNIEWIFAQGCPSGAKLDISKLRDLKYIKAIGCSDNSLTGKLSDLPKSVSNVNVVEEYNITGNLSDLKDNDYTITDYISNNGYTGGHVILDGTNIGGDIADVIKDNISYLIIENSTANVSYSRCQIPASFKDTYIRIGGSGVDTGEVSKLLLDLDTAVSAPAKGSLTVGNIVNGDSAPGANEAANSLKLKGFKIIVEA